MKEMIAIIFRSHKRRPRQSCFNNFDAFVNAIDFDTFIKENFHSVVSLWLGVVKKYTYISMLILFVWNNTKYDVIQNKCDEYTGITNTKNNKKSNAKLMIKNQSTQNVRPTNC